MTRLADDTTIKSLITKLNSEASAIRTMRKDVRFARWDLTDVVRLRAALERYEKVMRGEGWVIDLTRDRWSDDVQPLEGSMFRD